MYRFETHHPFFFYVGKDEQGVEDLQYGATYKEHLLEIPVKYQDINNSWNLIYALNEELSLLIDICEAEEIAADRLSAALEIAEGVIGREKNAENVASMSVFVSAIKTAISHNSPLLIWW